MAKDEIPDRLDGRTIARKIYANRDNVDNLRFWAGMACARLEQYQDALEAAGIELPDPDRK